MKLAAFFGGKPGDRVTTHDGLFTRRPLQLDWKHYVFVTDSKWEGFDDTRRESFRRLLGSDSANFLPGNYPVSISENPTIKGESIKNRRN